MSRALDRNEKLLEIVTDFMDAVESACVGAKRQIAEIAGETTIKGSPKLPFDASKINWQDRENEKGKFQVSEDYDSLDHKALLKFLNEHDGGCITSKDAEGRNWFYWVYTSGAKIGRKLKSQKT